MKREEVIKQLIKKRGQTLKGFAEEIGMPYTTFYSMLERGIGTAGVDSVMKICRALDITTDRLELLALKNTLGSAEEITTIAANHDGEWSAEELEDIEKFKDFVRAKRKQE